MGVKRADLQGIRGIAIIFVVIYHFFPNIMPNGLMGVDMFFVLSGYLMMSILSKIAEPGLSPIFHFYLRRFRRILPLYYVVILAIIAILLILNSDALFDGNGRSSLKASLLIYNIQYGDNLASRYDELLNKASDMFTHTWSLCVEMQWYLLVPIIVVIGPKSSKFQLLYITSITVPSLYYYLISDDLTAFFSLPARIWEFCVGMIVFVLERMEFINGKYSVLPESERDQYNTEETKDFFIGFSTVNNRIGKIIRQFLSFPSVCGQTLITAVIITTTYLCSTNTIPPESLRIIIVILTAAIIFVGGAFKMTNILQMLPLVLIGDISYAWYLVHWPVYVLFHEQSFPYLISSLFASLFLAVLIHVYYEKFYLTWEMPHAIKIMILLGLAAIATSATLPKIRENIYSLQLADDMELPGNLSEVLEINLKLGDPNLYQQALRLDDWERINQTDYSDPDLFGLLKPKNFTGTGKLIFLITGNSYAINQGRLPFQAFKKYAKEFYIYGRVVCEPLNVDRKQKHCEENLFEIAVNYVKPDIVFLIARIFIPKEPLTTSLDKDPIFLEMMERLKLYQKYAKKIYILMPMPDCFPCIKNAIDVMVKHNYSNFTEVKDQNIDYNCKNAYTRMNELIKRCPTCEPVDYNPVFTDKEGKFISYDKNGLFYIDNSVHFTPYGLKKIQPLYNRLSSEFKYRSFL